jgi:hypothetical protein
VDVKLGGRRFLKVATILTLAVLLAGILVSRPTTLRAVGRALVADDPIRPADVIVIAIDAGDAGVLEAADLVRHGFSRRVAQFADPPEEADREFARRSVEHDDRVVREARQLRALGVEHVEQIPPEVDGTEEEGRVFPAWCAEQHLRSVIVVSTSDHTRRLRRVLHRSMKGHAVTVMVRSARYSEFDPDRWWRNRTSVRTGIFELEKLLLDLVSHPFD